MAKGFRFEIAVLRDFLSSKQADGFPELLKEVQERNHSKFCDVPLEIAALLMSLGDKINLNKGYEWAREPVLRELETLRMKLLSGIDDVPKGIV